MSRKQKIIFSVLIVANLGLLVLLVLLVTAPTITPINFAILNPKGLIALKQRNLLITATLLMLVVVIPVFIFTAFVVLKYKTKNEQVSALADINARPLPTLVLWAIPSVLILIIAAMIWKSTPLLDPHKPITSELKPVTVQVIALQWKWLFIYPEQNIATVNFLEFPVGTPIHFELTADEAAMNSFWIPELGGQMYAMTGMTNQLNLIANQTGEFSGSTAEMSGRGFAGMRFTAKAVSQSDFDQWVRSVHDLSGILDGYDPLTWKEYNDLIVPSENTPTTVYSPVEKNLYNTVMMKYMSPAQTSDDHTMQMEGMR